MAYDKIFARSFSRYEQKKLGCGALVGGLLVALSICTVFKPYLVPLQVLNLRLSMGAGLKMLMITDTSHSKPIENKGHTTTEDFNSSVIAYIHGGEEEKFTINENKGHTTTTDFNSSVIAYVHGGEGEKISINETVTTKMEPVCNFTGSRSDFCEANGDIRIQGGISSTIYIASPQTMGILAGNSTSWEIRPYARKTDATAMSFVRKWSVIKSITSHQTDTIPGCTVNHKTPAILFSVGGYSGNHFHAFTDVVIPLFLTSRPFNGEVQFLLTDQTSWWINKFRILIKKLSNYEVIDIDKDDDQIHCFPRIIVGLKSHKELNIDPSKPPYYSMDDFRVFLRSVYSLNRTTAIKLRDGHKGKKARLLLISRKKTRSFTNEKKIAKMARRSGFQVVVAEATSLPEFAQVVNSCDAVMGVHGAGLTNIVFLPDNAVFIQIVPLGKMEWLSRYDFGDPAKDMKLRYLEYSIKESESSLIQQYPRDHAVFKDPYSLQAQGWLPFKSVYLDKQNVKLDVKRFRPILSKALELLHDDQKPL